MESASSPHWCPRPRRLPALRSGCGPAEVTALCWHLGEMQLLRDGANGKVGESALKMFLEEISEPIFLLGEKQEKNRQPLSVAQAHIDSYSLYHTHSLHPQIWVGSCDEMEIVSPMCHAGSAVTETCHPHT